MKTDNRLLYLLLPLLFWGCNDARIKQDIQQLQSAEITLPQQGQVTVLGRDTLIPGFMQSELKLIVYTDSVGCSSCTVGKMYLWNSFVKYARQYGGRLKYYYILSPRKQDLNKVRIALKGSALEYPVIIDTLGEFGKQNSHIPQNKALHTFLLDENNDVVLVGSPLYNKEIEELFYQIVEKSLGQPNS